MDWTNVLIAVITLTGSLGGSLLGIQQSNKVVELRLNELEKKVDKYNNIVERVAVVESSLQTAHHRLDDLECVLPRMAKTGGK